MNDGNGEALPNMKDVSAKFGTMDGLENFELDKIQEESESKPDVSNQAFVSNGDQGKTDLDSTLRTNEVPLSRHIPKELLSHHPSGASKNLLTKNPSISPRHSFVMPPPNPLSMNNAHSPHAATNPPSNLHSPFKNEN